MDTDIVIIFFMVVLVILLIAVLAHMVSQQYIQQMHSQAMIQIFTGDDTVSWPKRRAEMEQVTENIIEANKTNGKGMVLKIPDRRPRPSDGKIDPIPQSYDKELSAITNPNHTQIGPEGYNG